MNHPFWRGEEVSWPKLWNDLGLNYGEAQSIELNLKSRWLSPDIISMMLVHTTIEKKNFIGNMSHHLQLLLFCAPTSTLIASFSLNYFPFYEDLYHPILITGLIFFN